MLPNVNAVVSKTHLILGLIAFSGEFARLEQSCNSVFWRFTGIVPARAHTQEQIKNDLTR